MAKCRRPPSWICKDLDFTRKWSLTPNGCLAWQLQHRQSPAGLHRRSSKAEWTQHRGLAGWKTGAHTPHGNTQPKPCSTHQMAQWLPPGLKQKSNCISYPKGTQRCHQCPSERGTECSPTGGTWDRLDSSWCSCCKRWWGSLLLPLFQLHTTQHCNRWWISSGLCNQCSDRESGNEMRSASPKPPRCGNIGNWPSRPVTPYRSPHHLSPACNSA